MSKGIINLILLIVYAIGGLILIYAMSYYTTYLHETVHKQIFEAFGCKAKIVIHCGIIGCSGYTEPINCTLTKEDYIKMESLHLYNEIINYNLYTPLCYIALLIYLTGFYLLEAIFMKD